MERLALFDIDCTLIDAHGAGGRAIMRAIKDVYGVEGELGDYSFHGRTDPGIVRDLADLWGAGDPEAIVGRYEGETQPQVVHDLAEQLGTPDDLIDALVDECVARYVELLRGRGRQRCTSRSCPASRSWSRRWPPTAACCSGCSPATSRRAPASSWRPPGSCSLFKVAAYGSDSALRPDLPAVAVARAEELTGRRFAGKEIVVIGDTPADIECGAALGVKAIAVATGRHGARRARRPRAGLPLRRPERLARGLRGHPGLTPARLGAPSRRGRQPKRAGESGAEVERRRRPPASSATSLPVTGPSERPSMQWPVARITRSRRGTRPTTGRPSGVTGRGPRQICRTGAVRGDAHHASRPRAAGRRRACGGCVMSQPESSRVLPRRRASPSGVSTQWASPR